MYILQIQSQLLDREIGRNNEAFWSTCWRAVLASGKLFVNMLKVNFEEENGVMAFTWICFKICMAVKVRGQKVDGWEQTIWRCAERGHIQARLQVVWSQEIEGNGSHEMHGNAASKKNKIVPKWQKKESEVCDAVSIGQKQAKISQEKKKMVCKSILENVSET